jgi:hypothetical protein
VLRLIHVNKGEIPPSPGRLRVHSTKEGKFHYCLIPYEYW